MIDVIVKTLDSQNRSFSVPDDFTVEQFKQHIAEAVSIPVESQRLIYCGRVLDDEKKLFDCNLNGKVIHLVERMPPSHLQSSGNSAEAGTNESGANRNLSRDRPDRLRPSGLRRNRLGSLANGGNAMYLGEMTFPAELIDAHGINIPQLGGRRLLQSRFDLATFMTDQLDNIVHRMEQASSGSEQASAPEQSSAPSASAPSNSANSSNEPDSLEFPHFLVHATVAETFGVETTVEVEIRPESEDQSEGTAQSESTQADTNSGNASANNSAPSSAGANDSENQSGSSTSQRRPPVSPANLGALLQRIEGINDRFRPFMRQYTDVMLNDPVLPATGENSIASVQQVINGVSEAMHFQSHLQHALSELMFDVSETPPRNLRFRPLLIQQSAVFQSSIPVQAVIPTINPPSFQSQSTAPTEDTQEDEEMADAETETEGGESAEVELTATSSAEPAAQSATATDAQPSTETPSAASGTSSANAAQGPGQSQASSNAASGSRRSRIFSNIPGRSVGRRGGGLASLIPGMSSCFDPFLPCNSHHIRDRDRRRNYFFPPGAAIGQITTVTAIPATVEVPTSGENQSTNGQQAQQQTQASNNGGPQSATPNAQGGSEETDPSNLHGGRSLRFRFIEDAMSRLSSTLQGATRANGAGSNAASSGVTGNGANRRGAATLIGMSPIVEMISEPVINLVSNSDGQSRIFRLPPENAANYSSVFSAIASEMANAASQAASQAQSNQPLLSSLLQIVSESMSFEDIITSPNANIPLLNVHSRLQSFIQRRIPSLETYQSSSNSPTDLISNSYSHPLFTRPVREVLSELEPSITRLLRSGEIRDDYRDAITNVMNVIEVKLYNLLGILVYSPDSRSFQQMLYCEMESVARMLFRVLLNRCEHGHDGLHRIAQAFITLIMNSNISQNLKMWIVHATVSFLRSKLIVNPERAANASVSQERSSQQGTSNASNASNGSTTSSSNREEVSVTPPCSAPSSTSEHLSPDSGSSLANLMQIISQNLSLGDAIRISCGTNVPLSNVGTQLQDFLRRRFPSVRDLQRRSSAPIDIVRNSYGLPEFRSPIRELYSELRAAVLAHLSYAEMRENVDAVTSVMEVIESRLYVFLGVLFFSADWESFETMIRSELNLLARNLLTTIYNCCLHEREGLLQVSQVFLSTIMRSKVPQPLKAWVVYTTISYLRSMLSGSVLRTNEFVRLEQASNQPLSNDITMNANAGPRREAPVLQAAAASPAVNVPSPIPRSASSPEQMDSDSIEEELAPLNPSLPNEPLPEVSIGSEEWHNHVRHEDIQEWVPIITRDAQYQRRQSPQRPFSDAYLSGMPNKRRRLITTAKPQSGRVSQFISESLERAINSAQVGTSTVTSAVVQHASVDPTLRAAYVQQLRTRTDLSSNPDFNPAKYPNANNYFKKK